MPNYFFNPGSFPEIPKRMDAANDDFLFQQGATKGWQDTVPRLPDAYGSSEPAQRRRVQAADRDLQADAAGGATTEPQTKDIGWLLTLGELFTLVAYGQLILENAKIYGVYDELVDQIFDFMVRDFSSTPWSSTPRPPAARSRWSSA